jgi:pseudouridine-5'-monophosphatase
MGIFWSAPKKPQITHVVFDLDGTLIDTEESYFKLQIECLRKYGHEFTLDDKRRLLGRTTNEEIKNLIDLYKLDVTEEEYLKVSLTTELIPSS